MWMHDDIGGSVEKLLENIEPALCKNQKRGEALSHGQ